MSEWFCIFFFFSHSDELLFPVDPPEHFLSLTVRARGGPRDEECILTECLWMLPYAAAGECGSSAADSFSCWASCMYKEGAYKNCSLHIVCECVGRQSHCGFKTSILHSSMQRVLSYLMVACHHNTVTSEGQSLNANVCILWRSLLDRFPSGTRRPRLSNQHYQTKWAASVLNMSVLWYLCGCVDTVIWRVSKQLSIYTSCRYREALIWNQLMNTSPIFPLISGLLWSPLTPEGRIYASIKYQTSLWCRSDAFMAVWKHHSAAVKRFLPLAFIN